MLFVTYTEEEKSTMMMDLLIRNNSMLRAVLVNQSMIKADINEIKSMIVDIRSDSEIELAKEINTTLVDAYNGINDNHIDLAIKSNESYVVDIIEILRNTGDLNKIE